MTARWLADRPQRPMPRGSGGGFAAIAVFAGAIPMQSLFVIGEWSGRGIMLMLDNLLWCLFGALLVLTVPAFWLRTGRWWVFCWYWVLGAIWAVSFPLVFVAAMLLPSGIVPRRSPDPAVFAWFPLIFLTIMSPAYYFLVRMLRLNFWKPWSLPESWESDAEEAPEWAVKVTSSVSPAFRDHFEHKKHSTDGNAGPASPSVKKPKGGTR